MIDLPGAPDIVVEFDDAVAVVRLNRPGAGNSFTGLMHESLPVIFRELSDDDTVRAIVLTGAGANFCTGGDPVWVHAMLGDPVAEVKGIAQDQRIIHAMQTCTVPIVAAVNGPAVGLGCSIAIGCDLVMLSTTAHFADPHVSRGLVAGDGGAVFMPALVPLMRAKQYLFTGDPIAPELAVALGLAIEVIEPERLMTAALDLARRLAAQPAYALQQTKRAVNLHLEGALGRVATYASETELVSLRSTEFRSLIEARLRAVAATPDTTEASATTDRRQPPRIAVEGNGERHSEWHATLALAERLNETLQPVIDHLLTGMALPLRDRELMILRRAWLTRTAYQWVSHVGAARAAGLTDDEIERVTNGPRDRAWSAADRDVLTATDELVHAGRLTDQTWNALATRYDHRQLVELPLFVGAYAMLGYAQTTLRVRPAIGPDRVTDLMPFD